jgi:hypothetical protein
VIGQDLVACGAPRSRNLIVAHALAGRPATAELVRRPGLNNRAATGVGNWFTSSATTADDITGLAWVLSQVAEPA